MAAKGPAHPVFLSKPVETRSRPFRTRRRVYEVEGPEMVVAGDTARESADVFHVETRRPMLNGLLNPHEPHKPGRGPKHRPRPRKPRTGYIAAASG